MLSVDASGVVPVGVRPPPPLRGSSPCEAGQFCHPHGEQRGRNDPPHGKQNGHYGRRMENRRGVTSRTEFIKIPTKFLLPQFSSGRTSDGKQCFWSQRIANIRNKHKLPPQKNMNAWPETLFSPKDSSIASGVCINGCAVCINATDVSTDATGDYRFSRRKLDFFSHKNNFISFLHPFFPHYGIRSLMSFARNAFSKINERPKPVLSPLNFYCPNFVPSKAVVQIESGK